MLPTARIATIALAALLLAPGFGQAKTSFTNNRALAFGRFVAGTGGTIILSPAGARTSTGGVLLLSSSPASASFTWSDTSPANAGKTCAIGLPSSATLSNGTNQMTLNQFTSNPSGTSLMTGGSLTFTVGATLTVGANQPRGNYSGSFSVTIQYQ